MMSRPPPPPTFPTPNVTRSSTYPPPPGPVYPPQQPATYATSQPLQPPSAHRDRDPYPVNTYASSAYPYPSSQQSYPSAHLPSGPPQAPPSIPIPSIPGEYGASTSFSGAPPPPMMQRGATLPTPGQGHNPNSMPYYNVPAPVIAHQPSHSEMPGGTRSVTEDWSHHDQIYSHNEDLVQRLEAADSSSDRGREKGPPNRPGAGRSGTVRTDVACQHCGRVIPRTTYDSFGGFCKEKHRNEWYARLNQNQHQHRR